ncbi:unnamed protein product [Merluccius merluccius]
MNCTEAMSPCFQQTVMCTILGAFSSNPYVSMSLCQVPPPSDELVKKYEDMKSTFYSRLIRGFETARAKLAPMVQQMGTDQQEVKEYLEAVQVHPKFQGAIKIASGLAQEASPMLEKARLAALGHYEYYLRPSIGAYLDESITQIKSVLNKFLPAQ